MDEAKKAEEREKDAEAKRLSRALSINSEIQHDHKAFNARQHKASYTALDPEILQAKNLKRAESEKERYTTLKMELVEDHPALSKILKRPRIDDASDDSSRAAIPCLSKKAGERSFLFEILQKKKKKKKKNFKFVHKLC